MDAAAGKNLLRPGITADMKTLCSSKIRNKRKPLCEVVQRSKMVMIMCWSGGDAERSQG